MIRVVLVGWSEDDWRLYRQPQWMAEVRRDPTLTRLTRHHFDIEEKAFLDVLEAWNRDGAGSSHDGSRDILMRHGAVEVIRP